MLVVLGCVAVAVVSLLPDAELYPMPGESHLGGLGRAEEILRTMIELWDQEVAAPS